MGEPYLTSFIWPACFPKGLLLTRASSTAQGLRLRPAEGVGVRRARPAGSLGPAAAHCGLDRLVAREDSGTLRCPGLHLARDWSDAGHRCMQESPNCPWCDPDPRPGDHREG